MNLSQIFQQLGIALGLGLLVGMQRERVHSKIAGIRTFPLITVLGTICALLAQASGSWMLGAGILGLAGLIVVAQVLEARQRGADPGLTTEVAMLLMYCVGAYLAYGYPGPAIAVGGGVAVLLQMKGQLHGFVARLGDKDLKAIMQFALISLVILPVLPNRTYGPFDVFNPRQTWWMVVLIVGISLGGYIVYKFFGQKAGALLAGVLGGLISSTATTVSYAKLSKAGDSAARLPTVVILVASAVVYARLLLEIAVVAPPFLRTAAGPMAILLTLMGAAAVYFWSRWRDEPSQMPEQENPSELKPAILFGALYALAILAVAAAKHFFGNRALYVVAALSGLTDVDAITLSSSQLVAAGRLDGGEGWRIIVTATLSNLVFKALTIAALGHRRLLLRVTTVYGIVTAVGLILLLFCPWA
jgi:uncharacterized membrane protein (DUF4010 family)